MALNRTNKLINQVYRSIKSTVAYQSIKRRNMSSNTAPEVIFEEFDGKGVITLNRPKALNALNLNMVQMIYPKLKEWEKSKNFVIIKGVGDKAFCAGGDVRSVTEAGKRGEPLTREFFKQEYYLNYLIGTYHIPYIALINGITMGGGVGLSVHGQYRVATERTLFAMPETAIGLFPDVGGTNFLSRLGGRLGIFLALTGHRLKGRDTVKAGIATHFCDSSQMGELQDTLLKLQTPYPEEITKILDDFSDASTIDKDKEFSIKPYLPQIQHLFDGESVEDIIMNLEREDSEFSRKMLQTISKMSPTSMKITFESMRQGETKTLQECLVMEYRLSQRCCEDNDFYEGVRATLIDKDNSPKWKPATLAEVTDEILERYFSPLPDNRDLVFSNNKL